MNWRGILVLAAVIVILLVVGPENTAAFLKGIGSWIGTFINSL